MVASERIGPTLVAAPRPRDASTWQWATASLVNSASSLTNPNWLLLPRKHLRIRPQKVALPCPLLPARRVTIHRTPKRDKDGFSTHNLLVEGNVPTLNDFNAVLCNSPPHVTGLLQDSADRPWKYHLYDYNRLWQETDGMPASGGRAPTFGVPAHISHPYNPTFAGCKRLV